MRLQIVLALAAASAGAVAPTPRVPEQRRPVEPEAQLSPASRLPLHFERNDGQADDSVHFIARPTGFSALLTTDGAVLLPDGVGQPVRMRFDGASTSASATGTGALSGRSNYLIGDDRREWVVGAPHFSGVSIDSVGPGVSLVWRSGAGQQLTYDLTVEPGFDPGAITMSFEGADSVEIDECGRLVITTDSGEWRHSPPAVFQEEDGRRASVRGAFVRRPGGAVGFAVAAYDRSRPLVIDPAITYSTFLGGTSVDRGSALTLDSADAIYVAGLSYSVAFPLESAFQTSMRGGGDGFVTKLSADGASLEYSTYIGGSLNDRVWDIAVDDSGFAYVVGQTDSTNFPTESAFASTTGGGSDGFVAKLADDGASLQYSTYIGGGSDDLARAVAVDDAGAAFVTGETGSNDFPTANAIQDAHAGGVTDAFVVKLAASGSTLTYATYLGGSDDEQGVDIGLSGGGEAYVTGPTESTDFPLTNPYQDSFAGNATDVFVTRLSSAGDAHVYSTYVGGAFSDESAAIVIDSAGAAYVAGFTSSRNFPIASLLQPDYAGGNSDGFVFRLAPAGDELTLSTYIGGTGTDLVLGLAVDTVGAIHLAGWTTSRDLPTVEPIQDRHGGGTTDGFYARIKREADEIIQCTYVGGPLDDRAFGTVVDASNRAVFTGDTDSSGFPTENAFQSVFGGVDDAFITVIGPAGPPDDPSDLEVSAVSDVELDLAWLDNGVDEDEYEVQRAEAEGPFETLVKLPLDAVTHTDATVAAETTYTYRVRATNAIGESGFTEPVERTTPPATPTDLAGAALSNTSVSLGWTDTSSAESGFELERRTDGDFTPLLAPDADAVAATDSTVEPETTYVYRLRAINDDGDSRWVASEPVTTPPRDPTALTAIAPSDTDVVVTWQDESVAETVYELERGTGCPGADFVRIGDLAADAESSADAGLAPETTYSYRVRAANDDGVSEWSEEFCITTPPAAPSGSAATARSPSRVRLTWTDASSTETSFRIERMTEGGAFDVIAAVGADETSYDDLAATRRTRYVYRVSAVNEHGASAASVAQEIETPAQLIIRTIKIKRPRVGKLAASKRVRIATLKATGEFDAGAVDVDLSGAARLAVGNATIDIPAFVVKGKGLRYDGDGVRLDLRPGKGSSRVTFKLTVEGDVAAAIDGDSELTLGFHREGLDAVGAVQLVLDAFSGKKGDGVWVDPPVNLTRLRAALGRGLKDTVKIDLALAPGLPVPEAATDIVVEFGEFMLRVPSKDVSRNGDVFTFKEKIVGARKIVIDFTKRRISISLKNVELGDFEQGSSLVPVSVTFADLVFDETPVLASKRNSLRY